MRNEATSEPVPGACADPSCPVLHTDPANPIHPPFYEPGGPMWDDVPPGDVEPPHLAHEWAALTADEQREVEAWFAARKGSCPACLGAMPAHQMGLPLQEAHRSHVEGRDV